MIEEENTATIEEQGLTCFVRHEDAGGQCWEPGAMRVYGLGFCQRHGEEIRIGAGLESLEEAGHFFERFRNPYVPQQSDGIERVLSFALARLHEDSPSDLDHWEALQDAYPEIPDKARSELERCLLDQSPEDELPVLDMLLIELHRMHTLLRITHAEGMTWLVEVLEQERQGLAVQAAYLLRNPNPPEPDDED